MCEYDIVSAIKITEEADGTLTPVKSNPAVPVEMLKKVQDLLKSGINIKDIVDRLRTETVPKGYPCHPWRSGVYDMSVCVVCEYCVCMYCVHVVIKQNEH